MISTSMDLFSHGKAPVFSLRPPFLSQSSYFCPLGIVAPSSDSHASNCSSDTLAFVSPATVRSAPYRLASLRSASSRMAPNSFVELSSASLRSAFLRFA